MVLRLPRTPAGSVVVAQQRYLIGSLSLLLRTERGERIIEKGDLGVLSVQVLCC